VSNKAKTSGLQWCRGRQTLKGTYTSLVR
jgi:hypothetical protein